MRPRPPLQTTGASSRGADFAEPGGWQLDREQACRLAEPHAGGDEQLGEESVAVAVAAPEGGIGRAVGQAPAQADVAEDEVVPDREEAGRAAPALALLGQVHRLGLAPTGQERRRPRRPVGEREPLDVAVGGGPPVELVEGGYAPVPGAGRHRRLRRAEAPGPMEGGDVSLLGLPHRPAALFGEEADPGEQVPGVGQPALLGPHAHGRQLPEELVEAQVVGAVVAEDERHPLGHAERLDRGIDRQELPPGEEELHST